MIKSNDKKRARLEAMRYVLRRFDYPGKDLAVAVDPDSRIVGPASQIFELDERPVQFPAITPQ